MLPDDLMVGTPGALSQMIAAYDRVGGGIIVAAEKKSARKPSVMAWWTPAPRAATPPK